MTIGDIVEAWRALRKKYAKVCTRIDATREWRDKAATEQ